MVALDEDVLNGYSTSFETVLGAIAEVEGGPVGSLAAMDNHDPGYLDGPAQEYLDAAEQIAQQVFSTDPLGAEEGHQLMSLISNNVVILNNLGVKGVGDGRRLTLPVELDRSQLEASLLNDLETYDLTLLQDFQVAPLDAMLGVTEASVDWSVQRMNYDPGHLLGPDHFTNPGEMPPEAMLPSLSAAAAETTSANYIDHVVKSCSDSVGGALLSGLTSGLLMQLDVGSVVAKFLDSAESGGGSWWRTLIRKVVRATSKWVTELLAKMGSVGVELADAAKTIVEKILELGKVVRPAIASSFILDEEQVRSSSGGKPSSSELSSIQKAFDNRMKQLKYVSIVSTAIAGAFLGGPVVGVVSAVVVSVIAIWLASDFFGYQVGLFKGKPNLHDPDLARL